MELGRIGLRWKGWWGGSTPHFLEFMLRTWKSEMGNDFDVHCRSFVNVPYSYWDSFKYTMDHQVKDFCEQLASDPELKGRKINLIGYSQG